LLSHYTIRARRNLPDKELRSSVPLNTEGLYLHPFLRGKGVRGWSLVSRI